MQRSRSGPLRAFTGTYAPVVHYASVRWLHGAGNDPVPQHLKAYAVLGILDGLHQVRLGPRSWRLEPGDLAILAPDRPWVHVAGHRARRLYAVGSLVATALVDTGTGNACRIAPGEPAQPPPADIWGIDLPVVQPRAVAGPALIDLQAICDLWWADDLGLLRSNHHFAAIFLRAVLAAAASRSFAGFDTSRDEVVQRALAAIDGRPPPPSATAWAALVGMHRNRFADRFHAVAGLPPGTFLRRVRLRRAEELLMTSDSDLDRVATDAGYRDAGALRHAFAAAHGCTPTAWRRSRRTDP